MVCKLRGVLRFENKGLGLLPGSSKQSGKTVLTEYSHWGYQSAETSVGFGPALVRLQLKGAD